MSMSSSLFNQKNGDYSSDIQDIRQQNRMLYEQNTTLKKSLQDLISINTELTQSIQQFNNSHVENFPHINQQQIEQLALRVVQLEQQLERQKKQKIKERPESNNDNNSNVEQTLKVIEELVNSMRVIQQEYQEEIQRMQNEMINQRNQWIEMSETFENKLVRFEEEYSKILTELHQSEHTIKSLETELQDRSKNLMMSKKEMKISTTIEDLRMTLERQIEEKDRIIRGYQRLIDHIKGKLNQKIGGA